MGTAAAGLGMVGNLGMCLYTFLNGRSNQVLAYFIGFVPLAALFFWTLNGLSHIGKIGG